MTDPDDTDDEDLPGGTPVEDPEPGGMPLPTDRQVLTARDAFPFVQKRIG